MRCERCVNCVGFFALSEKEITYYCIFDIEDLDDDCGYFESLYEVEDGRLQESLQSNN